MEDSDKYPAPCGIEPDGKLLTGYFTENGGQWDEDIKFAGSTNFGKIMIMNDGICFQIEELIDADFTRSFYPDVDDVPTNKNHYIRYTFEGGSDYTIESNNELPHRSNYFIGSDETRWAVGLRSYETVILEDVWGGIDLRYTFSKGNPKYEFIVNPGSDPEDIAISVEGVEEISVDHDAVSMILTDDIRFMDGGLRTFYFSDNEKTIGSSMRIFGKNGFSFKLDEYDSNRRIVIDPIIYTTYIGAEGYEYSMGMERDAEGCFYICCQTNSVGFPTTAGSHKPVYSGGTSDIAILKMNETATRLIYSTYIGGSFLDSNPHIDINSEGEVCYIFYTDSDDVPTTSGAYDETFNGETDHFVGKLSAIGDELIFGTYLGSDGNEWTPRDIAFDLDSNILVTGDVGSATFPTTENAFDRTLGGPTDAYLAKLSADGSSLLYSTFIGGSSYEKICEILICENGDLVLSGNTESTDFPTTNGAFKEAISGSQDDWVMRMESDGSGPVFSTYLGGRYQDGLMAHLLDDEENILITGWIRSDDFPTTENAYDKTYNGGGLYGDTVVAMMKSDGSGLIFSTYLGGSSQDSGHDAFIDPLGRIFLCGWTQSYNFPLTPNAMDSTIQGDEGYVSVLDENGENLLYSTFIGGSWYDRLDFIMQDPSGDIFTLGYTESSDLPTNSESYDETHNGGYDLFLTKIEIPEIESGLSPPVNFNVEMTKEGNLLEWDPPEDWETCGITGYNIYRREYGYNMDLLTFVEGTSYLDEDVVMGKYYYYSVSAVNASGESPLSREVYGTDDEEPSLVEDLSAEIGHPNEFFNVSARISDNIGVLSVYINLWYNGYGNYQYSLNTIDDEIWFTEVQLRPLIGNISYQFRISDHYGNLNLSDIIVIPLVDHIAPNITLMDYKSEPTTGEPFWIHFQTLDDIAVWSIGLDYWFGDSDENSERLIWERVSEGNARIMIPEDEVDMLNIRFILIDSSFNQNSSEVFSFKITDNDPPKLLDGVRTFPANLHCGSNIKIPLNLSDNVGIGNVSIRYRYGDDPIVVEEIIPENTTYYLAISPPVCRMDTYHLSINLTDLNGNSAIFGPYHMMVLDNMCPCIAPMNNITVEQGHYFCIEANATDNIGIMSFYWDGCPVLSTGPILEGSISAPGTYNITVTAYDWMMNSNTTTFSILVKSKEIEDEDGGGVDMEFILTIGFGIASILLVIVILTIFARALLVRRKMKRIWEEKSGNKDEESIPTTDSTSEPNP
ncbi:MAG: SBBP repeat-containing protein [Thermoplasmatota archaeon]